MDYRVVKVITINNSIVFVISQENDFFTWEISAGEWFEYWDKRSKLDNRLYILPLNFTPFYCDMFINDPINDTVGTSTGSFDTIENALKYYDIL